MGVDKKLESEIDFFVDWTEFTSSSIVVTTATTKVFDSILISLRIEIISQKNWFF